MKRLQLMQVLKSWAAYTLVSGVTVDAGLLLADRTGAADIPASWYVNAPLGAVVLVGLPVSFNLAARLVTHVNPNPGRIAAFEESAPSPLLRSIPFMTGGKGGRVLASTAQSIFGETLPHEEGNVYHPAIWRVPIPPEDNPIVVRELELASFLDAADKRQKHKFSRRYWTQRRRPALYLPKYLAYMRLLVESGLIEGRHEQGGASGILVTRPHFAITFLKYESPYRVN